MIRLLFLTLCLLAPIPGTGFADEQPAPTTGQVEFFEKNIRPLLAKHCGECHSKETGSENGELVLETVAGIAAGGSRGKLWSGTDPEQSLLVKAVRYRDPDLQMPPEGKLKPAEIELLERWIREGAPLPAYKAEVLPEAQKIDYEQARKFWSFRPLGKFELPEVSNEDRVRTPLDRFVIKQLEDRELKSNPEAERITLIRRLSFDLIGLPPTVEEVEAFLADASPDAYERLVERLLASPHYGERWARVWLDLARYTDTTASWLDSTASAWLYRDWVISAFNRNRPYDEFVRLQLAGDLIPDTPPEDLAALGFLGLSPTYWKELKLAPEVIEQVVAEEWDERIDAVSRTFLGLTIACARCHDHKFDPITTRDYYALAGVFASTQFDDRPMLPADEAEVVKNARAQIAALEAKLNALKDKKSEEAEKLNAEIESIRTSTPHYDTPWMKIVREASLYVKPDGEDATRLEYKEREPRDLPVFKRGNPSNPGPIVPRGFPVLFSTSEEPVIFEEGSGRKELAETMLTDTQPLLARVFVNRIWLEHFGQGIVRTPSDFGRQGEAPTHPELLEWLSAEFVAHGWNIKWLHRQIVLSSTYRQSSAYDETSHRVDPENRLLWRMHRRRLSIEMWRDAMLAVAGNLDRSLGGEPVPLDETANNRRTIYGKIARRELDQMLRMYDFPDPNAHSPNRTPTTTPLQQLFVLNAPFVEQQAQSLYDALPKDVSPSEHLTFSYRRLFAREPTADELELGLRFLQANSTADSNVEITPERWQSYLHALLGLNEFLYVD